jgi:hypothetical protein
VHDAISSWAEIRRTLRKPGKEKEKPLPAFAHAKGLVCCITVLKKSLRKKRKVPMPYEEKNYK